MTNEDLLAVLELLTDWYDAQVTGDPRHLEWVERHLADDFVGTTQLVPGLWWDKARFIALCKDMKNLDVEEISSGIETAGDLIITRALVRVNNEEFTLDFGPDLPSGADFSRLLSGGVFAYCSVWRKTDDLFQMMAYHQLGRAG